MISLRPKLIGLVEQIGFITAFTADQIAPKWIRLDTDQFLDPQVYSALFAKVGYVFGQGGPNNTHFKLPRMNSSDPGGRFIKIRSGSEILGQLIAAERPRHTHRIAVQYNGYHVHSFPTKRYLQGIPLNGRMNKNGGGTQYTRASSQSHDEHYHSSVISGEPTEVALSNTLDATGAGAPPALCSVMCIYAGV